MKTTVGKLRSLIKETLYQDPKEKADQIVQAVVDTAETYVDSLVAGHPDSDAAEQLKDLAEKSTSLAKWLASRREAKAPHVAKVASIASDVVDLTSFWKRPSFLGKDEHTERVQRLVRRLRGAHIDVVTTKR